MPSIGSDMLVSIIKDTLIRLNLPLSKARGQCYDGASNMSGLGMVLQLSYAKKKHELYTLIVKDIR